MFVFSDKENKNILVKMNKNILFIAKCGIIIYKL